MVVKAVLPSRRQSGFYSH